MTITFDKTTKQLVFNALRGHIPDRHCPVCQQLVTAKNFGAALWVDDRPRFVHKYLPCLLSVRGLQ